MIASDAFITLVTGDRLTVFNPKPEQIVPEAIATGLSNECRWGSQMRRFYNVAQHSYLVSDTATKIAIEKYGLIGAPLVAVGLAALLHDAAEGLGFRDMPTPIKRLLPHYEAAEHNLLCAVLGKFLPLALPGEDLTAVFEPRVRNLEINGQIVHGWTHLVPRLHPAIWDADSIVLATEHRDLRSEQSDKSGWSPSVEPLIEVIEPWTPEEARQKWLAKFIFYMNANAATAVADTIPDVRRECRYCDGSGHDLDHAGCDCGDVHACSWCGGTGKNEESTR